MICPSCNVEMESLVAEIFQCPQCRKIIKEKDKKAEVEDKSKIKMGDFYDGEYFHKNVSLNKQFEIPFEFSHSCQNNPPYQEWI